MSNTLLLEAKGLTKRFGTLVANDKIDIKVEAGKIHALLGENGAGKSTLVKMFYGSLQPNAGRIFWKGEQVIVDNPSFARQLGVGMVFQHFSLFEALTVVENISLAMPSELRGDDLGNRIEKLSADYGLPLKPDALVADLSVGERQRIEIVRCLLQEPKLLIMDEPTAVLTPQEA
ncbi:MAG: ATP-binding cassette domain-containing protein, partial [bacterium]|nr:ATP-binding cassette domain-containing protein [bacterium]